MLLALLITILLIAWLLSAMLITELAHMYLLLEQLAQMETLAQLTISADLESVSELL